MIRRTAREGTTCSTTGSLCCGRSGGGNVLVGDDEVTHGFVLQCPSSNGGNSLTLVGDFGKFKLGSVAETACTYDEDQSAPGHASATFNEMTGSGTGTCNGQPADVTWRLTDEGEANTADEVELHVTGGCTLDVVGVLTSGNHQAHG